jgi:hypothetical protein
LPQKEVKIMTMPSHPNRSKTNIKAGSNPSPAQIRRWREELVQLVAPELAHDINAARELAGSFVYASWRTWQNWEAEADSVEHRRMHPATGELFQAKLAALKLLASRELSPALLRELGLYLPPVHAKTT